jgi:hypothetical protein
MHSYKSKISFISLALASLCATSVNGGWIDPDTPDDKRTSTSLVDGTEYDLVSSHPKHFRNIFNIHLYLYTKYNIQHASPHLEFLILSSGHVRRIQCSRENIQRWR